MSAQAPELVLPPKMGALVDSWLEEDIPWFDVGAQLVGKEETTATMLCKSPGVMAGQPFANAIFEKLGCTVEWLVEEGTPVPAPQPVARITGPTHQLLRGERLALNVITRASGVATAARRLVDLKRRAGWHGEVAGTRKTTPGFRLVEKYALLVGGASTHRMDLSGMVMLKDNHLWATGGIAESVRRAREVAGFAFKIEVECRSLEEALEAAGAGADVCMLDNFAPAELHETARKLKEQHPTVIVEGSGGIREDTIEPYFGPHVDVLSMGSLTQGYAAVDFSMKLPRPEHMPSKV